ncbi:MAG: PD40 domain-containing protein [Planctomycetes bacterium]|nr:PD40 domain-containing protein [Planctomycetota bacterium]
MKKALAAFAALALCGCVAQQGPTLTQPEVWEPPELAPGNSYFTFSTATTKQHTFATRSHYAHPCVSPDGKWIAYSATINGEHPDVFIQPVDGRSAQEVASHPLDDITPAFSPDATRIAFASNRDGRWNIYVAGLDAAVPVQQITDDGWESFAPSFAPDGRSIAYATRRKAGEPWMIAVAELATGSRTLLCEGVYPEYCPTGEQIVFSRNSRQKPGWPAIWTISVDGSRQTEVYRSDDHGAITPSWAGKDWILFSTIGRKDGNEREGYFRADDVWVVHVSGTQASRATWHGMQDWDPSFDPHSERCYYVSNRDGVQNIYSAAMRVPKTPPDERLLFGAGGR